MPWRFLTMCSPSRATTDTSKRKSKNPQITFIALERRKRHRVRQDSLLPDLETTALGFRLIRLHQCISAVFKKFNVENGLFFLSAGQISHIKEVESMVSLHKA